MLNITSIGHGTPLPGTQVHSGAFMLGCYAGEADFKNKVYLSVNGVRTANPYSYSGNDVERQCAKDWFQGWLKGFKAA